MVAAQAAETTLGAGHREQSIWLAARTGRKQARSAVVKCGQSVAPTQRLAVPQHRLKVTGFWLPSRDGSGLYPRNREDPIEENR
jgi:hypothetical protein